MACDEMISANTAHQSAIPISCRIVSGCRIASSIACATSAREMSAPPFRFCPNAILYMPDMAPFVSRGGVRTWTRAAGGRRLHVFRYYFGLGAELGRSFRAASG